MEEKTAEKMQYLKDGAARFCGKVQKSVDFVLRHQLKDRKTWQKFVNVFVTHADGADGGWRGEYFGKMMRGACMVYRYAPDGELYEILGETVKRLLAAQDKFGRISTYSVENEFRGWDMWCRKYVLVGCLYFYGICKDGALKERILRAMCAHADYIVQRIGKGKTEITETSEFWGGVNSCTVLEPILQLYKLTKQEKYLRFAEYILSTGGCRGGNLLEIAEKGEILPYRYPEVKAYETMSFFEGVLAYYEVTGKERYLKVVKKFAAAVQESEVTAIGSAGCTGELFDRAAVKQADGVPDREIMQETCVTVTWMRLQERLLRLTGDCGYAENIERSAYNALYGSINVYGEKQYSSVFGTYICGLPFDSYSPLVNAPRGIEIGGIKGFAEGGYYGCCACIAAAGIALFPLAAVMRTEAGFAVNFYFGGEAEGETPQGNPIKFCFTGEAAKDGKTEIKIESASPERFSLWLRVPKWSNGASVSVCGKEVAATAGYCKIERVWKNGDEIVLNFRPELSAHRLSGKTAFTYGALALARDQRKEGGDIMLPFTPIYENGALSATKTDCEADETVRFLLKTEEGEILLTDYASCGKHWENPEKSKISVWLNAR